MIIFNMDKTTEEMKRRMEVKEKIKAEKIAGGSGFVTCEFNQ